MKDEQMRIWKEVVVSYFKVPFQYSPGKNEKKLQKDSVRINEV
jgi:hypothetical protein